MHWSVYSAIFLSCAVLEILRFGLIFDIKKKTKEGRNGDPEELLWLQVTDKLVEDIASAENPYDFFALRLEDN